MNIMNVKKYISLNYFKVGSAVAVVLTLSVIGVVAPRNKISTTFALDCANQETIPSIATFNPFQVGQNGDGSYSTQDGSNCLDEPTLSVKPQGSSLYYPSANANAGDNLTVSAYIHNGARQDVGTQDEAFNITATFTVDTNPGSSHNIHVVLNGQDINGNQMAPKTGDISINTPDGATLQVVSGSGVIEDHLSNQIGGASVGGSNFTVNLGSQMACFDYARFVNFTVTVVGGQTQSQASGQIVQASLSGTCPATIHLQWTNNNTGGVAIFDQDGQVIPGSAGFNGSTDVANIQAGKTYTYDLWDVNWVNGQPQQVSKLDSATVNVPSNTCQQAVQSNFSLSLPRTRFAWDRLPLIPSLMPLPI